MSRFTDYTAAAAAGHITLYWIYELIDIRGAQHVPAFSNWEARIAGGTGAKRWYPRMDPMSLQASNLTQQSAVMRVPIDDPDLIPLFATDPLHPSSQWKVYIYAAVGLPPTMANGVALQQVASMLPDTVTVIDTSGGATEIEIQLTDMKRPIRSSFTSLFSWEDGEEVIDVVDRIVGQTMGRDGPAFAYQVTPTGWVTPKGSAQIGQRRDQVVAQLLAGAGHELVVDPNGVIHNRPVPPSVTGTGEHWRYGQPDGLPIHRATKALTPRAPVGVRVEGGSLQNIDNPVTWVVWDLDPNSEGYYHGFGETNLIVDRLPWVKTVQQAFVAGYAHLRRDGTGPGIVKITTAPNPMLQEGDDVDLYLPRLRVSGMHKVLGYYLPLQAEQLMEITLRASWDPSQGLLNPNDPGADSPASVSEVFTSGSLPAGWATASGSWTSSGQIAYNASAGIGVALWGSPLLGSDQTATAYVAPPILSGHYAGAIVRSDGGANGIAGVIQSDGKVLILQIQNGTVVKTLSNAMYGGTLTGGVVLSVIASGSSISVDVNGTTVTSTTDPGTPGTQVGMIAQGGAVGSSTGISSFNASSP